MELPTDHDLVVFFPLETCQTSEVLKSLQFVHFVGVKRCFFLTAKLHTHEFDVLMIEEFFKDWKGLFVTPPKTNTKPKIIQVVSENHLRNLHTYFFGFPKKWCIFPGGGCRNMIYLLPQQKQCKTSQSRRAWEVTLPGIEMDLNSFEAALSR